MHRLVNSSLLFRAFLASSYDPNSSDDLGRVIFQRTRGGILFLPAGIDLGRDAEERAKRSIRAAEAALEKCRETHGHLFE